MTPASLSIQVNGEARTVKAGTTVAGLLGEMKMRAELCAVERNGEVVPRADHARVLLMEGDAIEVVTFVGGG